MVTIRKYLPDQELFCPLESSHTKFGPRFLQAKSRFTSRVPQKVLGHLGKFLWWKYFINSLETYSNFNHNHCRNYFLSAKLQHTGGNVHLIMDERLLLMTGQGVNISGVG